MYTEQAMLLYLQLVEIMNAEDRWLRNVSIGTTQPWKPTVGGTGELIVEHHGAVHFQCMNLNYKICY